MWFRLTWLHPLATARPKTTPWPWWKGQDQAVPQTKDSETAWDFSNFSIGKNAVSFGWTAKSVRDEFEAANGHRATTFKKTVKQRQALLRDKQTAPHQHCKGWNLATPKWAAPRPPGYMYELVIPPFCTCQFELGFCHSQLQESETKWIQFYEKVHGTPTLPMSMLSLRETWRSMKATQPGPGGARKGTQDSQMPMSHFLKDGGYWAEALQLWEPPQQEGGENVPRKCTGDRIQSNMSLQRSQTI